MAEAEREMKRVGLHLSPDLYEAIVAYGRERYWSAPRTITVLLKECFLGETVPGGVSVGPRAAGASNEPVGGGGASTGRACGAVGGSISGSRPWWRSA